MTNNAVQTSLVLSPPPCRFMSEFEFLSSMHGAVFKGVNIVSGGIISSEILTEPNIVISSVPQGMTIRINEKLYEHKEVIIEGIKQILSFGIGTRRRFTFRVVEDNETNINAIKLAPNKKELLSFKLHLHLTTPTVIIHRNEIQKHPSWYAITARAIDRLIKLGYEIDKKAVLEFAKTDNGDDIYPIVNTAFFKKKRKSGRGGYKHNIMGMVGELIYPSYAWKTAQVVKEALRWGIGKNPALGMGRGYITIGNGNENE
ncbi:MAG: hypothetical protein ACOC80_09410 [Petrotogales bacterium]